MPGGLYLIQYHWRGGAPNFRAPIFLGRKGQGSHRFGVAPAMSGLLLTVVRVFETRKEAETWVAAR